MSTDDPAPDVPDIEDPRPSTPLTEDFRTGTANDPPRWAGDDPATLTVDGETVAVPPDATLLDAVEAAGREVPALCHYDRDTDAGEEIGPRSTCRTCTVEVDGDRVSVASRRGEITVRARVTDRPGRGVVFVPMHFADGAANELTGEQYDPTSGIPEYKVASVRVRSLDDADGAAAATDD